MKKHLLYRERQSENGDHLSWEPSVDLYKAGNSLYIRAEVAGIHEKSFSVLLEEGNRLIISGSRQDPAIKNGFYQMEIPFGHFRVSVDLAFDFEIDPEKITSSYENGFLCVKCPVLRNGKSKKLTDKGSK